MSNVKAPTKLFLGCLSGCVLTLCSPALAGEKSADTEAARLFDAAAAWEEFEQLLRGKYAYIDRDDMDVDAQLARSQELASQAETNDEFRRIIHQTALTFMDPHLIVGPFTADDYAIVMTAADLDARFEGGRLLISDVRAGSPAFEAGIRSGDEMLAIDGELPNVAAMLPFGKVLAEPTAAQLDYGATLAINGRRGHARKLQVRGPSGEVRYLELISATEFARSLDDREPVTLTRIGEQAEIAVIRINNSLGNNDTIIAFDQAMKAALSAKAIVLDMRDTPSGGNTEVARSIIGHFTREMRPYQVHEIPAFEREFTVPRRFVEYVYPREPNYAGPVYVLHGRWTGSMGEGIVIGMDAATDAVTIGSDMGDLLGGLWNWDLEKSEARVDLGGEALFHVNGAPREDFVANVPLTPADTDAEGNDPAIAQVLKMLGTGS
ncbi:S41 family peptidase [Altererythrobacter sp. GH1-8]|uniref:S41 family peptidase n=1 Tax=Altererythrobacter sp. GH1-8 TaxID=3349333 RepID=UPI00374DE2E9